MSVCYEQVTHIVKAITSVILSKANNITQRSSSKPFQKLEQWLNGGLLPRKYALTFNFI